MLLISPSHLLCLVYYWTVDDWKNIAWSSLHLFNFAARSVTSDSCGWLTGAHLPQGSAYCAFSDAFLLSTFVMSCYYFSYEPVWPGALFLVVSEQIRQLLKHLWRTSGADSEGRRDQSHRDLIHLKCQRFLSLSFLRLVQPAVHQLHAAASHLLLPAADVFSSHAHGHAVLGFLLDRPQSRASPSFPG